MKTKITQAELEGHLKEWFTKHDRVNELVLQLTEAQNEREKLSYNIANKLLPENAEPKERYIYFGPDGRRIAVFEGIEDHGDGISNVRAMLEEIE